MEMLPHERSLVERMKDEPFALIGVNSDPDFEALKKTRFVDAKVSWRSFTDFRLGGDPPKLEKISDDWRVHGWPTLFLLDGDGRILEKWIGGPGDQELDRSVDEAVAALKRRAKEPSRSGAADADH